MPSPAADAIDAVLERLRLEMLRVYREAPEQLERTEAALRLFASFDELWAATMRSAPGEQAIGALDVAASALRFIMDLLPSYVEAWKRDRALLAGGQCARLGCAERTA
jgi:hypothetical protein